MAPVERYIRDLISEGEHDRQDFKFEITDSRKIARTLAAFSNTSGGRILIGVKDNGRISGISSDEEYHMIEAAARMYCKPPVRFDSKKLVTGGKTILEVLLTETDRKPVKAMAEDGTWKAYIRIRDQNLQAPAVQISVWKKQMRKRGLYLPYDEEKKILLSYLSDHEDISLSRYCRLARITRQKAVAVLSDLVVLGLISMEYNDTGVTYSLKPGN